MWGHRTQSPAHWGGLFIKTTRPLWNYTIQKEEKCLLLSCSLFIVNDFQYIVICYRAWNDLSNSVSYGLMVAYICSYAATLISLLLLTCSKAYSALLLLHTEHNGLQVSAIGRLWYVISQTVVCSQSKIFSLSCHFSGSWGWTNKQDIVSSLIQSFCGVSTN